MDCHRHIDSISISCPFSILWGSGQFFYKNGVFLSLKINFIPTYSANPDEMQPYAAFYLSLICLPKNWFIHIQNKMG